MGGPSTVPPCLVYQSGESVPPPKNEMRNGVRLMIMTVLLAQDRRRRKEVALDEPADEMLDREVRLLDVLRIAAGHRDGDVGERAKKPPRARESHRAHPERARAPDRANDV